MYHEKRLKVKMSELPVLLEVEGPNGEQIPYELKPARERIGVFLNKVSMPIRKLISRT